MCNISTVPSPSLSPKHHPVTAALDHRSQPAAAAFKNEKTFWGILQQRGSFQGSYRAAMWKDCNWCTIIWLSHAVSLFGECSLYFEKLTCLAICKNNLPPVFYYSVPYFGTCEAKSYQSRNACSPASALAEHPSRKGWWWQALDCPWYSKQYCPSSVPLLLDRPTLLTPSRTGEYQCYSSLKHP